MFLIASGGRCATQALCHGLDRFSDHAVRHEPAPALLLESFRKHTGLPYESATYKERMAFFAAQDGQAYGESIRCLGLIDDVMTAAPGARLLLLVREPLAYVASAASRNVFRKNNHWDQTRLMPAGWRSDDRHANIAAHWVTNTGYLLAARKRHASRARLHVVRRIQSSLVSLAEFLRVEITDPAGLTDLLDTFPNASVAANVPRDLDTDMVAHVTNLVWNEVLDREAAGLSV